MATHVAKLGEKNKLTDFYNWFKMRANQWISTYELMKGTHSVCVHTRISELRNNGIRVDSKQEGQHHYYMLVKGEEEHGTVG